MFNIHDFLQREFSLLGLNIEFGHHLDQDEPTCNADQESGRHWNNIDSSHSHKHKIQILAKHSQ